MNFIDVTAGDRVLVTDSEGNEFQAEALSGIQGGHLFRVVWINRPLYDGGFEPIPWPAESVQVLAHRDQS